jgi:hypothetical protein
LSCRCGSSACRRAPRPRRKKVRSAAPRGRDRACRRSCRSA